MNSDNDFTKFLKFTGIWDDKGVLRDKDVVYIDPGMVESVGLDGRGHTRIEMVSGAYWVVNDQVDAVAKRIDDGV